MKLLTKEIMKKIPSIYSQENETDPIIHVKFFFPAGNWTWYATEASAKVMREGSLAEVALSELREGEKFEDVYFFGMVVGQAAEWGEFALSQLEEVNVAGLKVERDLHFEPQRYSEAQKTESYLPKKEFD